MTAPSFSSLAAERISDRGCDLITAERMPGFFASNRELTIREIVALTGAEPHPDAALDRRIGDIAPLDTAGASDIGFLDDAKHLGALAVTRAGACLMASRFKAVAPNGIVVLVTDEPYRAFVAVARALFPSALRPSSLFGASEGAEGAYVHSSARIEAGVTLDPLAVIGPGAEIGAGTLIAAGAVVGPGVAIGRDCAIGAGATVQNALIGDRVTIHPGARVGQDGFGYLPSRHGHQKIPQTRRVIIQDDVEIGANAAIDRGFTRDTIVGEGTKIDNLVQIAHNCVIGRHCLIAGRAVISGDANVGDFVMMGGKGGGADQVTMSETISDTPAAAPGVGSPAPVRGKPEGEGEGEGE